MISHLLDETFLVVQGDAYTEMELDKVVSSHREYGGVATIVLKKVSDPWLYGVAVTDKTYRVMDFQEKPAPDQCASNRISTGIYVLEPEVLDFVSTGTCDFAKDVFPRILRVGKKMFGCECKGFWVDVGSLEGYLQGIGRVLERLEDCAGSMVEAKVEGKVWIGQNTSVDRTAHIFGPSLIEDSVVLGKDVHIGPCALLKAGSRVEGGTIIERSALFEGVSVGANGVVRASVLGEKAVLGSGVIANKSVVGQGSVLKDGVRLNPGSKVWPNVIVEDNTIVKGVLLLPYDKPFYFYTDIGRYTGILATSISGLIESFAKVEVQSLEFHLYRRDFERWIRDVIQTPELAEKIADLRKEGLKGEVLRQRLIKAVEEWSRFTIKADCL
jgi:mannose-1-phosphate guanylyltransferase/phosphomannomutase